MADTTTATGLGSLTAKPKASFLEEYERQMAQKKAMAPTVFQQNYDTAAGRLASIAQGQPSQAVQAAQQSSREALARQAGNLRSTTAQATAASGSLGQGAGMRAAASTEQNILARLADSRLAERQAVAQEAMDANQSLISGAQADRTYDFQKQNQQQQLLGTLIDKGTVSQQMEAQAGLQGLAGITPNQKADEINKAAYLEATGSPEYLAQQATAKMTQMESESALKSAQENKQREDLLRSAKGSVDPWVTSKAARNRVIGDAKEGDIVKYGDKPYIYVGRQSIGSEGFTGFLGGNVANFSTPLYQIVLKDPITNETIYLKDRAR